MTLARQYSTLNFSKDKESKDLTLYSALFDIAVNRENGCTTNKQWVQPPWSIIISGVYIHALPMGRLYTDGFLGDWTFANSVNETLRNHPFLEDYRAKDGRNQGTRNPAPGLQRSNSQPPLKTARGSDDMISSASSSLASSRTANTSAEWEHIAVRDQADYQRPSPPPPRDGAQTLHCTVPASRQGPPTPRDRKRQQMQEYNL